MAVGRWLMSDRLAANATSVRAGGREEELRECPQDNVALERKIPVLEVFDVTGNSILDIRGIARFAAKATDLRKAGDSRLNECTNVIVFHELGKLLVVLDQVRPWTDDAHIPFEHVPELRNFVDAQFSKPFA